jgi:hypothetical protein
MTTFQDPPPQSRRAARQGERGELPDAALTFGQYTPPLAQNPLAQNPLAQTPPAQSPQYSTDPFLASGGYPAAVVPPIQQPSFQSAPMPQSMPQAMPQTSGRRARPAQQEGLVEVPVATPQVSAPPYVAPQFPPFAPEPLTYVTQGQAPAPFQSPPTFGVQPPADPAPYRVRDFSPEGRRQAVPELEEPPQWLPGPVSQAPSDLDYRTQAGPLRGVQPQAPSAPAAQFPISAAPTFEPQTLSRRELRALRAEEEQVNPTPSTALADAMAEFESLTKSNQLAPPMASERVDEPAPKTSYTAPAGHWSRQADLDDETQPYENTITREVGGGNVATTTSALVLSAIPTPTGFPTALNSTGEILFTGSIELPRSLGSIGGDSRRYDDPGVDFLFDSQDREIASTDSAPVSAVKAVSTHTSARGVIHSTKPRGNRVLTILLVTASVMAVGVVALLIAGMVFKVF